jgi:hypothetical protein
VNSRASNDTLAAQLRELARAMVELGQNCKATRHGRAASRYGRRAGLLNEAADRLTAPRRQLTMEAQTDRDIPAFAGYLAGTAKTGTARMLVNLDATAWACVEHPDLSFRRLVIEHLGHEFMHALEEVFGLLVDEDAIEKAIERVREEQ